THKNWSPYISGIIIGLLQTPAVLLLDSTLGFSSAFVTVVKEAYLFIVNHESPAALGYTSTWQLGLGIGTVLGAFLSAKLSKSKRPPLSPVWKDEMGITSKALRYSMSFLGGALMLVGARMANGCTSGNGISGTSQLDISSWIVLAVMFIAAVITANLLRLFFKKGSKNV
ncbi:MAG: YeeE/YedE thiosulfate transporter family protein, partial [Alphaproteobacteria bacterium]|nr:YeeE/YedE thiosulfate transporter family protein [Alphaproteobacteria bacterium]